MTTGGNEGYPKYIIPTTTGGENYYHFDYYGQEYNLDKVSQCDKCPINPLRFYGKEDEIWDKEG